MSNILDTFNSLNTTWDSSGFPGFPTDVDGPWLPKKHDHTQDKPGFWGSIKSGLADADWGSAFGSPQEEAVAAANSWKNAKTMGGSGGGFTPTSFSPQGGSKTGILQPPAPQYTVVPGTPGRPGLFERIGNIAGQALIGSIIACDVRLKTDIAPLESTEVNDALADVAFFVKEIRECT